ncbi:MAG: type III PLP-dependent enzyme [Hyphomonas sp.]|uniref:type III PLP-dependent enzyme n=1 Tax=Hyphomonas sp. TaxID=87 RepID=UPI00185114C5|nr:type III PLP-dependent enzyme [Hyphomonas sp.]MBU3921578.1 type III PLP-dependent enzyme [Alphaproteobacteria bacterium]MBA3069403.1 type III PLP-dependent enzyme [Hyphomonas sp.]MBU4063785.1 type III PLP-dependent enzyme [Alphaproteobacteria bacterium]MBU4164254.1 type III PLP-dependent enzyme [Alphaproteobacteria bacterium]MBU4568441.1 type III PLP-dependent enzyme [Alphaproteobacteria bacterium]
MHTYATPYNIVRNLQPELPVYCFRPERVTASARWFVEKFPAQAFYAVKANPAPHVLDALWEGGVRSFDAASEKEIQLIHGRFPGARIAFLHPVKPRHAIKRAYENYGVRIFVTDTVAELNKILEATGHARDLTILVRIAVSCDGSALPLANKFGAGPEEAAEILRLARRHADEVGVSFHVGSQAMKPSAWAQAMADASRIIIDAGVTVDIVDVGGGFPAIYADTAPPEMDDYVAMVMRSFENMFVLENAELWCEPGRALAAEAESLLVRVDLAKGNTLYINDGSYGSLYDAVHERWEFPIRAIPGDGRKMGRMVEYTVYGPTCDSTDKLAETVWLPAGMTEGDYIEFGNIGAYGRAMATRFNGFGEAETLAVQDAPWPSLYGAASAEVVAFGSKATN